MKTHLLVPTFVVGLLVFGAPQQPPFSSTPQQKRPPAKPSDTGNKPKKPLKKHPVMELAGFDLLGSKQPKNPPMIVAATRGLPQLVALAPRLGKFYGTNSVFAWSYEGKANQFVVAFSDDAGAEIFRAEVNATQYRYPADAPRFQPGKIYTWTVVVTPAMLGTELSEPAGFVAVSQQEREEIEKALAAIPASEPYQAGLARAKLFTDHRLWYDAIGAYADLIASYPDRADLYEQRGTIYAQVAVTQSLAEQDFARAEKLQQGTK